MQHMTRLVRAAALGAAVLTAPIAARAASPPPAAPEPTLPNRQLHATVDVEVNKHGQVVRVRGGQLSHDSIFDTMTIGNALQMWIRRPDGTAITGLFRVSYDYDPRKHSVSRHVALLSSGGAWANEPGAATRMMETARRETAEAYARLQAQEKQRREAAAKHLPDINAALKRALKSPTPHP